MSKYARNKNWNYGGNNWRLSRSKIDLFVECPRCFYLDNKLGIRRPSWPSFTLNTAVDELLKTEFDTYRTKGEVHPFIKDQDLDLIPFDHPQMDIWRHNFTGVETMHKETGMTVSGAVDDIWITPEEELVVVDYKSTSKEEIDLSGHWYQSYFRQLEVYQWLLRQNGFTVSDTGYLLYANGIREKEAFNACLHFDMSLHSYEGNDDWIDKTLEKIKTTLEDDKLPARDEECEYCKYVIARGEVEDWLDDSPQTDTLF